MGTIYETSQGISFRIHGGIFLIEPIEGSTAFPPPQIVSLRFPKNSEPGKTDASPLFHALAEKEITHNWNKAEEKGGVVFSKKFFCPLRDRTSGYKSGVHFERGFFEDPRSCDLMSATLGVLDAWLQAAKVWQNLDDKKLSALFGLPAQKLQSNQTPVFWFSNPLPAEGSEERAKLLTSINDHFKKERINLTAREEDYRPSTPSKRMELCLPTDSGYDCMKVLSCIEGANEKYVLRYNIAHLWPKAAP